MVFDPDDETFPTFGYSIGNSRLGEMPVEFICFYPGSCAGHVINRLADDFLEKPDTLRSVLNVEISCGHGFLDSGCDLLIRPIRGVAQEIATDKYAAQLDEPAFSPYVRPHTLLQVILPDPTNAFPGEDDFDQTLADAIPEFLSVSVEDMDKVEFEFVASDSQDQS